MTDGPARFEHRATNSLLAYIEAQTDLGQSKACSCRRDLSTPGETYEEHLAVR